MTLGTILNQIIPTYGNWGGPGWSAGERTPDGKDPDWNYATVDALDELFKAHDKAYWNAEHNASDSTEAAKMVYQADVDLLRGMQNLGVYKDTGLYSILYAPLATDLFGMKSLYDISNIMLTTLGKFDTSLDRFLFLEGSDLDDEDLMNFVNAYNDNLQTGHQTDYNPFTPQMQDPLVIDADKDGFISTVSLAESEVYFDITGNGVKTKTSWVKGNDAILVYDENEDGKIDNINEAFGNATTSGFDELRNTIDSNYDNKIDRKDILFNRLQLWHDYDQDGSVDEGELKSLKEEGISSIDLNSVQTNINLEGAVLTEASHYTDTSGNKELAADLEFQYMPKVDSTISAGNAGSIDVDTIFLPQLRGYGYVANSLLSYNSDTSLKELATKYANNIDLVANHFDEFIVQTLFTCKIFSIQKALHVKIQNTPMEAKSGAKQMVA